MAHYVFLSHSVKDKKLGTEIHADVVTVADAIVARLEADSVTCWVAPHDVVPGADWGESPSTPPPPPPAGFAASDYCRDRSLTYPYYVRDGISATSEAGRLEQLRLRRVLHPPVGNGSNKGPTGADCNTDSRRPTSAPLTE